jgi:hypothetical protein
MGNLPPSVTSFGTKGGAVVKDDGADLDPIPKAIEVVTEGTLVVLPSGNDDGQWVDLGVCPKGYRPPYRVRRVNESSLAVTVWIAD